MFRQSKSKSKTLSLRPHLGEVHVAHAEVGALHEDGEVHLAAPAQVLDIAVPAVLAPRDLHRAGAPQSAAYAVFIPQRCLVHEGRRRTVRAASAAMVRVLGLGLEP